MSKLFTVRQFAVAHPAFSEAGIRSLIAASNANGLAQSGAILRNGYRILIDGDRFMSWIKARQASARAA